MHLLGHACRLGLCIHLNLNGLQVACPLWLEIEIGDVSRL
jgi:hypothetical protein